MNKYIKDIINFSDKYHYYGFFLATIMVFLFLDYQHIFFYSPSGLHFIRQTDGLSFASNYFHEGMNFFSPGVYNLTSTDGKAACEFPIIYYLAASLYFIFGEHEIILRLINTVIMVFGLFNLYRLLILITNSKYYSLIFCFLFFSSAVVLYYTNNFLPDSAALGLILSGWYFFYRYYLDRSKKQTLYLSFFLFTLGSLIKVTFFYNPISAFLSLLLFDFFMKKLSFAKLMRQNYPGLILFLFSISMIIFWNIFVKVYNSANHDNYFLTYARPIWNMDKHSKAIVWDHVFYYWFSQYYYQRVSYFFAGMVIVGLFFIKKSEKKLLLITILMILGSISYIALFYAQFKDHDYYFMALIPAIIFVVILSYSAIHKKIPILFGNPVSMIALLLLCALSLRHAGYKINDRYTSNDCYNINRVRFVNASRILDNAMIPASAKLVIVRDSTMNGGLYFLKRHGWTIEDTNSQSIERLKNLITFGADYIVLTDSNFTSQPDISNLLGKNIISTKNWSLYKCGQSK